VTNLVTDDEQSRSPTTHRAALAVLIVAQLVAAGFWFTLGRRQWFVADEWDFLAARDGGSLHDLFRPHNEHWSTIPILVYRCLYNVFGLHSYVPYRIPVLAAHLAVVTLLWTIMRRSAVSPWIATAAAGLFLFFGTGYFNITYGFQIGFTGALAFGLAQLLAADHDRYALAILFGLCALLSAGIAIVLVGTTALMVRLQRGWRTGLAYVLPLAAIFILWSATAGAGSSDRSATIGDIWRFASRNLTDTFDSLAGNNTFGAVALFAALGVGLYLGRHRLPAVPIAMLTGAFAFAVVTGIGRGSAWDHPTQGATAGRYEYVTAALLLPAIAWALTMLVGRRQYLLIAAFVFVLVGIPANIRVAIRGLSDENSTFLSGDYRTGILLVARVPVTKSLRDETPAEPIFAPGLTFGWLRDGIRDGRIPAPPPNRRFDKEVTDRYCEELHLTNPACD
jgi:hypothetical protein